MASDAVEIVPGAIETLPIAVGMTWLATRIIPLAVETTSDTT